MTKMSTNPMPSDSKNDSPILKSPATLPPNQFAIAEMFWWFAIVAIVLGIAVPFLRVLPKQLVEIALVVAAAQLVAIAIVFALVSINRIGLLKKSGKLIARGSSSEMNNPRLAYAFSIISLLFTIAMQLVITFLVVSSFSIVFFKSVGSLGTYSFILFSNVFAPILFLMNSVRFLRWRIHSSTVEFFEEGVSTMDVLERWENIELRPSATWQDRVMVYYPRKQTSMMVWLDQKAIARLFELEAEKRSQRVS